MKVPFVTQEKLLDVIMTVLHEKSLEKQSQKSSSKYSLRSTQFSKGVVGFNFWIKITFTYRGWGFATDHKPFKLQPPQNKVFHTIAKLS